MKTSLTVRSALFIPALASVLLAPRPSRAADVQEAVATAHDAFLAGRYDDAESAWNYLSELGVAAAQPEANLALTLRDQGRHEAATAECRRS